MRQDQFEKMLALHEKLADVYLAEADPDKWPGAGIEPIAMDQKTRGDRFWSKRNAVATIALMQRTASLVDHIRTRNANEKPGDPSVVHDAEDDLDAEVAAAEKEAAALMRQLQDPKAKAAFDRKVHGKA